MIPVCCACVGPLCFILGVQFLSIVSKTLTLDSSSRHAEVMSLASWCELFYVSSGQNPDVQITDSVRVER